MSKAILNYKNLHTIRPRVFVSSVIEGFQEYREAARRAIKNAGGEPILVNEDFPSLASSPRNICLDAVDSADVFIMIIGARGGWEAPSGKLVIEEEYERARFKNLPIIVFLQNVKRDLQANEFATRISDYIDGLFRVTFLSAADLQNAIENALEQLLSKFKVGIMDKNSFLQFMMNPYSIPNETSIRFIISPERVEEIVDPTTLISGDFMHQILELGHSRKVKLFDYSRQKDYRIEGESLVIHQSDPSTSGKETVEEVRLELNETGRIIVDSNVTRRVIRGQQGSLLDIFVVAEEDIETVLSACFRFTGALFDDIDKYKRHQRFLYNAALVNLGTRKLLREPKEQRSYQMDRSGHDKPIIAFDASRLISRSTFNNAEGEIKRVLTLFSRKI